MKVPGLDGTGKMSKSENQNATLYLADTDEVIRKKVMKAKTDTGPTRKNSEKPEEINNIFMLMKLVSAPDTVKKFDEDYAHCIIRYGDLKKQLAEDIIKFISPIREKAKAIYNDEKYLNQLVEKSTEKAGKSAEETIRLAREIIGLKYF